MVAILDAGFDAAMRDGVPLRLLVHVGHPDGDVRVWSGGGTLAHDGADWLGAGALARVTPVASTTALAIREVRFELARVPPEATAQLSGRVRGRTGRAWLASVGAGRRVLGTPLQIIEAVLDVQTLEVGEDRFARLAIVGQAGFYTLERAQRLAWTPEQQMQDYPGDTGLDLIPGLVDKDVRWTRT